MAVKVADAGGRKALARVALIATLLAACCVGSTADQALAASVARPLIRAGGGVVNELPTVNVPSVLAKAIEASAGSPSHSRAFTDFMAKFDKATGYCPDGPPPCEESIRRERIFLENVATIEAHNAAQDQAGGMRLGVTRFTDLTQEEFSQHHGGGFAGADDALHTHHADQDSTLERASERHKARGWARLFSPRRLRAPRVDDGGAAAAGVGGRGATLPVARLGAAGDGDGGEEAAVATEPQIMHSENGVSEAVENAARARNAAKKPHSKQFVEFAERFGKHASYCGSDPDAFPCEESYRREIILLHNIRHIEEHNAARPKGGMKKVVTRFADLTPEEFASKHATYDSAGPTTRAAAAAQAGEERAESSEANGPRRNIERVEARQARRERRRAMARMGESELPKAKPGENARRPTQTPTPTTRTERLTPKQKQTPTRTPIPPGAKKRAPARAPVETAGAALGDAEPSEFATPAMDPWVLAREWTASATTDGDDVAAVGVAEDEDEDADEDDEPAFVSDYVPEDGVRAVDEARRGVDEAALGVDEAEAALMDEENDLAASAAAAFAMNLRGPDDASNTPTASLGEMTVVSPTDYNLPQTLDWRAKMDVGPLYSQGACSGCWAYSTVQVIADSKLIGTGHRPSPSPYYLLSCDELDSGCNTGNMATAYAWIQVQPHGILSVEDFPTTSDQCAAAVENANAKGVNIDGFCEIPSLRGEETASALLRALKQQPVAVGMNVKPLQLYGGGLVQMQDCPPASDDQINAINHAAVVMGWGIDEESEKPYFLVKNSYGQDWGENGYARIEMAFDGDSLYGACGFFSEQNYPLTDGRDCAEGSNKKWSEQRGEDVYLMPDNVVVLPNGGGILTPARIKVFGVDLTTVLKMASFACFGLCAFFLVVELYYCFAGSAEEDESLPNTPAGGVYGSKE